MDPIIKAAKKILKKDESGSMTLKALIKAVVEKLGDLSKPSEVKEFLQSNDKFLIEGKNVSLSKSSKKRKPDSEGGDEITEKKSAKKAKKEAKKRKAESGVTTKTSAPSSSKDSKEWRSKNKVVLKDTMDGEEGAKATIALNNNEAYLPCTTFESKTLKQSIDKVLLKQCTEVNGFTTPSAIQAQCWPILLQKGSDGKRRDIVGIAETGSGKTLAFSLPALATLSKEKVGGKRGRTPRMLVLAPTRELAMQSHVVIEEFGSLVNLTCVVIYGGVPKYEQKNALRNGIDCVVATPGRIKDLINEGACDLSKVSQLVLDEADRMLDMGFEEDVRFIIGQCVDKDEGRQTAMFSATWPAVIQKIAGEYMVNPVRVYVGFEAIVGSNGVDSVDDSLSANKRVTQTVEVIEDRARGARLRQLLTQYAKNHSKKNPYRVLIFALYKKEAARLEGDLSRAGYAGLVTSIHGDKAQDARTRALAQFKSGECPLLVATDVAARGLDIPNVELVINHTFPLTIEDYVHRIGRTGRAGKTGISYTLFQPSDKSHAGELQQVMKQAGQPVPDELMKFGSTIKKKEHKLYGNFGPRGGPMKKAVKITFDSDSD
jgi:ATP-dependent RNA helicase DBP3